MKELKDILLEKDIGQMTNILYEISQFCKKEQKQINNSGENELLENEFKKTNKLLLKSINTLNNIKKSNKKYFKDKSKLKINKTVNFNLNHNETDFELGLRVGMLLENTTTKEVVEIKTFDSDKNAIINDNYKVHPRNKYLNSGIYKRIS